MIKKEEVYKKNKVDRGRFIFYSTPVIKYKPQKYNEDFCKNLFKKRQEKFRP